ncbi:recombinase family protein [Nonomuraea sp. NPDC026600]|uniref:recombinase family protein n=1 Tax=Nonomuraea sp. NPDC026600 TaxID=3155363 RepID=UPI0033EB2B36
MVGDERPERRFGERDLDAFAGVLPSERERVEAAYVRVPGSSGHEPSLRAQAEEFARTSMLGIVGVYLDRASGSRENRPGLTKLLKDAAAGKFTVVHVTHEDRLARFGVGWITMLLAERGVSVEILHAKGGAGGREEYLADSMSLVATFAERMYGIRSKEVRTRLLDAASANTTGDTNGGGGAGG